MKRSANVAPRWRTDRVGSVRDIECWVPLTDGEQPQPAPMRTDVVDDEGPVTGIISPFRLEYEVAAGEAATRYLVALGEGRIIGARAPSSDESTNSYVPWANV